MSNKKRNRNNYNNTSHFTMVKRNFPEKLRDDHPFFGIKLDEDQINLRNNIWDKSIEAVFVDSPAGTGKSLVSIATSMLMCQYGRYSDIVYVMHPLGDPQGFLPGTITEKSSVYFESLYQSIQAVTKDWPQKYIKNTSMTVEQNGTGFITAITDTYLRGSNIGSETSPTILIIDEAQNFPEFSLRKVLTRACNGTKVIVIGHTLQCDLTTDQSGFARCQNHFKSKNDPRFAFCELHTCHRNIVAQIADEAWENI